MNETIAMLALTIADQRAQIERMRAEIVRLHKVAKDATEAAAAQRAEVEEGS